MRCSASTDFVPFWLCAVGFVLQVALPVAHHAEVVGIVSGACSRRGVFGVIDHGSSSAVGAGDPSFAWVAVGFVTVVLLLSRVVAGGGGGVGRPGGGPGLVGGGGSSKEEERQEE